MEAADRYNAERNELKQKTRQMLEAAGRDRKPSESDMRQMDEWLKVQPLEVILLAAGRAREMQMPLKAIEKNLKIWTERGIRTVSDAAAELDSRKNHASPAARPAPRAVAYSQRDYDSQFLNSLVETPEGGEKP